MGANILSLCDGISCCQIALTELDIDINKYYASEIDKAPIKITQENFPNTIQLGDVVVLSQNIEFLKTLPKIDLVAFGSPCVSISKATAGRNEYNNGLKGKSNIFYPCNDILQWIKKYNNPDVEFLIENVSNCSKQNDIDKMSELIGVKPILINSNLFSAQDRERLYWTNIPVGELPTVCNIILGDILDTEVDEKYYYKESFDFHGEDKKVCATLHINGHDILKRVNSKRFKCQTLTACRGGNHQKKVYDNGRCRKLTPSEYRKLQTIPDWYMMNVADSHIYNTCGDGWNIETIKFILKFSKIYRKTFDNTK